MSQENVRFYIGSLPNLVDAFDVEDNAPEEGAVALEVENADFEVNDDQAVVLDDQDVLIDVQDLEIDDQEVAPYALVVDHEEVVASESFAPYSRCSHYVKIKHAPVFGENYKRKLLTQF